MSSVVTLGVGIGTASSKGVLVDEHGEVLRSVTRSHAVSRPHGLGILVHLRGDVGV